MIYLLQGKEVGFAYLDVTAWVGRSTSGLNINFGQESRLGLPPKGPLDGNG